MKNTWRAKPSDHTDPINGSTTARGLRRKTILLYEQVVAQIRVDVSENHSKRPCGHAVFMFMDQLCHATRMRTKEGPGGLSGSKDACVVFFFFCREKERVTLRCCVLSILVHVSGVLMAFVGLAFGFCYCSHLVIMCLKTAVSVKFKVQFFATPRGCCWFAQDL